MYEMKEGIDIRNKHTDQVGKALEYTFATLFAYRVDKTPDCVIVELEGGQQEVWMLRHCIPEEIHAVQG